MVSEALPQREKEIINQIQHQRFVELGTTKYDPQQILKQVV